MFGHPKKLEIQYWVDFKGLEFAQEERKGTRWNPIEWLGRYLYSKIYESFFSDFPVLLYDWLSKLATQQKNFQGGEPKEWTSFLIERVKRINNPISRVVDFWVENIIEG